MFPILYENITVGTVPQDHGLGDLSDCISCYVEEKRNAEYELTMEYPANGIHAAEIANRRIIKAKPNPTDDPQLFRIDRIGKTLSGTFTVYAKHISYDISGYPILTGSASNISEACDDVLTPATCIDPINHPEQKFTIQTTKTTVGNFEIKEPSSVKSWFAGKEGSLLDVYGTGEWKYNNFTCTLMLRRGVENPRANIRYGKNLLELSQEMDFTNLYTAVVCYYKKEEENILVTGDQVSTGLTLDVPKVLVLDMSGEYNEAPTSTQLTERATQYKNSNNLTVPTNNITLNFVQSGELTERVDLCDPVNVYYQALGINVTMKCIRTKYDCINEKYVETEFGDVIKNLADTVSETNATASEAKSTANEAATEAASKSKTFLTEPVAPYNVGDIWIGDSKIYTCVISRPADYIHVLGTTTTPIEEGSTTSTVVIDGQSHTAETGDVVTYDGEEYIWKLEKWISYATHIYTDWEIATNYFEESIIENRIKEASEIITGNAGGYVILHCTNPDPTKNENPPDELLIVNNPVIKDATQVWRFNMGGLGFATSYASDNYSFALTRDGKINASMITTGELDASKISVTNLTADMFKGGEIKIGGIIDPLRPDRTSDGVLQIYDRNDVVMATMDKDGIKIYGEGAGNNRSYVMFDSNGMAGYDTTGTKIFWTNKQEFHMKKAVVEEEISCFGVGKFVRLTTYDQNNNVVNDGIALVGI